MKYPTLIKASDVRKRETEKWNEQIRMANFNVKQPKK